MSRKRLNLVGQKFGRLTILSFSYVSNHGDGYWNCICDCGKERTVMGSNLKAGNTKSCGCLQKERSGMPPKHGMSKTSIHSSWRGMAQRCYNPKNNNYHRYGGRGIKVCKRWLNSFTNFYKDMGEKPENKTLDRINNNGNYTPKNCKWSTAIEQQNNTRFNRLITIKGKTKTISEWSRIEKINSSTVSKRIKHGWSPEKSVMTKVM